MSGLLRAEWLKIRTTRTLLWYLLGMVVLVALTVAGQVAATSADILSTEGGIVDVLSASGWATAFALLFGIIGVAGEYRHETVTQTFLATPVRERVIVAKLVVYAGAGLCIGVVALLVTLAMALPWLAAKGADPPLTESRVVLLVIGLLAAAALWGPLGIAFSSLVTNQVGAIVIALVWLLIAESILAGLTPGAARYTPGGTVRGLMQVEGDDVLPMWAAAAVTFGYIATLAALGTQLVIRRDVT
jgi:hypothetical protein